MEALFCCGGSRVDPWGRRVRMKTRHGLPSNTWRNAQFKPLTPALPCHRYCAYRFFLHRLHILLDDLSLVALLDFASLCFLSFLVFNVYCSLPEYYIESSSSYINQHTVAGDLTNQSIFPSWLYISTLQVSLTHPRRLPESRLQVETPNSHLESSADLPHHWILIVTSMDP